jgi:hypothetical protein
MRHAPNLAISWRPRTAPQRVLSARKIGFRYPFGCVCIEVHVGRW